MVKILVIITLISFLIQIFYYVFFYLRLAFYKTKEQQPVMEPVSIIICARNEEENLKKYLPIILEQDYPNFEVVVVNDCSTDESAYILALLKQKYKHLYVTTIEKDKKFTHGKKLALTVGIKAAKNNWLLLTDADCYPKTKQWLAVMQKNFQPKTEIVLAYSGYENHSGFLNKIIRFDAFFIGVQYLSFALAGVPYMGVGRNLAYKKELYLKNKGFATHAHLLSGDDDLFVNQHATKKNTTIEISPESHVLSIPKKSFQSWFYQKQRHFTTAPHYKTRHKILLVGEIISRTVFFTLFFSLLASNILIKFLVLLFVLRMLIQTITLYFAAKKLGEHYIFLFALLFDFLLPLLNIGIATSNIFSRKYRYGN